MTTMDKYIAALKAHDWYYMYADSLREFNNGKEQWFAISSMQQRLDPDYTIFNEHAPDGMKVDTSKKAATK